MAKELRKGLKKGEYFTEGGRTFRIDEVTEDGYIAHVEDEPKRKASEPKEK